MPVESVGTLLWVVRVVVLHSVWARGRLRVRGRRWVLLGVAARANVGSGWPNKVFSRYVRSCRGVAECGCIAPLPLRGKRLSVQVGVAESGYTVVAQLGV